MIGWITRFGKGANIGFWLGALLISPFAIYAGYGLAGYYAGEATGISGSLLRILILIFVASGIMLAVALLGAFAGFLIEWLIKKIF